MNLKSIKFDDLFFEPEIRDGYEVNAKAKKIWAVELDLLKKLLDICDQYNLKVFVFAGTLLGAVRYGGFIPWDDDIDVCMLQEDFLKLESIADEAFQKPYFLQTALTDRKYFFGYGRLRNSETTGVISWNKSPDYNNGIFLDIFILNGMAPTDAELKRHLKKRDMVHKLLNTYNLSYEKKGVKAIVSRAVSLLLRRIISYEELVKKYRKVMSEYDEISENVTLLTHDWNFIHKYWCRKSSFDSIIYRKFENMIVPIPENYDELLKHTYGSYMEFPPIEKRGKWHDEMIYFDPDISYLQYFGKKDLV